MKIAKRELLKKANSLNVACPFDLKGFVDDNLDTCLKYLKKRTNKFVVNDWALDDIPSDWWYSGKEGLLRAKIRGIGDIYTAFQKLEWFKCAIDIKYFVKKYVKIISIDEGIIPFELYPYQEKSLDLYNSERFVINLSSRQTGKTQTFASFALHYSIFNKAKTTAVLAHKADQAQEILERIQLSYELLPMFLQSGVRVYNKRSMTLNNTSKIFSASSSSGAVRGKSISCVSKDTYISVYDMYNNEQKEIKIGDFYDQCYSVYDYTEKRSNIHFKVNGRYKVLTPTGWLGFSGILKTKNRDIFKLKDYKLECTLDHRVKIDGEFVKCSELEREFIYNGDVYDLVNVDNKHEYYTNGVISHNCLFIDECAFIPNDTAFYESTYPTISSGKESKIILASTPNGTRGMFYKIWQDSLSGLNAYKRQTVTWELVPNRDLDWKRTTIENSSEEQFRQEHCCSWRGSVYSIVSGDVLDTLIVKKPIRIIDDLRIFEEPEEKRIYIAVVDTSEGIESDYHAIVVLDVTESPYRVVATYKNNSLSPLLLPSLLLNILNKYNNAPVLIEAMSTGSQVANDLLYDLEYDNVLMTSTRKGSQFLMETNTSRKSRIGVKTSKVVKSTGCSNIRKLLENGDVIVNDQEIVNEIGTFVKHGNTYAAADGSNDDLVMCLVLFGWLVGQDYFKELTNVDLRKRLLNDMIREKEESVMPFGFIESDTSSFNGSVNTFFEH